MTKQETEFMNYVNSYLQYGERIELKINHSIRVQNICIEIAKSLNLNEEDIELAGLCGLLHDIGRFEQWKQFKTYRDKGTVDHGNLGYKILKKDNFIRKFNPNPENDSIILKAVKYHNKYEIAKSMTKKEKMFTNITRDADKLDLLYLYKINVFHVDSENKSFNDNVYKSLLDKKLVSNNLVESKIDATAVRLGFVFDLNYKKSYEIIKNEDYLNDTIEKQINETTNEDLINQLKNIQLLLNNYVEEKITC